MSLNSKKVFLAKRKTKKKANVSKKSKSKNRNRNRNRNKNKSKHFLKSFINFFKFTKKNKIKGG